MKNFPVIDPAATGENIRRLRVQRGLSVRDLQSFFGFEEPQAIYKWQRGDSLPTVDNLYALGSLLEVPLEQIIIPRATKLSIKKEQQDKACCSERFWGRRPPFRRWARRRGGCRAAAGLPAGPGCGAARPGSPAARLWLSDLSCV